MQETLNPRPKPQTRKTLSPKPCPWSLVSKASSKGRFAYYAAGLGLRMFVPFKCFTIIGSPAYGSVGKLMT